MLSFKNYLIESSVNLESSSPAKAKDDIGHHTVISHKVGQRSASGGEDNRREIQTRVYERRPDTIHVDTLSSGSSAFPTTPDEIRSIYNHLYHAVQRSRYTQLDHKHADDFTIVVPQFYENPNHPDENHRTLHKLEKKIRTEWQMSGLPYPLRPHWNFPEEDQQ